VTLGHRDQKSETYALRIFSLESKATRRAVVPRLRDEGGSAEQLFNAVDQAAYQKRFHEVLYVVLV
jgi:hypothetical protein